LQEFQKIISDTDEGTDEDEDEAADEDNRDNEVEDDWETVDNEGTDKEVGDEDGDIVVNDEDTEKEVREEEEEESEEKEEDEEEEEKALCNSGKFACSEEATILSFLFLPRPFFRRWPFLWVVRFVLGTPFGLFLGNFGTLGTLGSRFRLVLSFIVTIWLVFIGGKLGFKFCIDSVDDDSDEDVLWLVLIVIAWFSKGRSSIG